MLPQRRNSQRNHGRKPRVSLQARVPRSTPSANLEAGGQINLRYNTFAVCLLSVEAKLRSQY
jgi:hypothetical protein